MDDNSRQPARSPASVEEVKVQVTPSQNNQAMEAQPVSASREKAASGLSSFSETLGQAVGAIALLPEVALQQVHDWISPATTKAGEAIEWVGNNWFVRRISRFLNLNWLIGATDSVDLAKAEAAVKKLQQEHPEESPEQIAHRIMVEKATRAGGIGLATSFLPGVALALLAVDLAATTQLQAEMVHQIAVAYGLSLKDPSRKGEVLTIFGLGLGGSRLLRLAGLGVLRNVPFAGAFIGASSNAAMLYSLGYAACRFYEAKLKSPETLNSKTGIAQLEQQSKKYLETAIAQEAVMDRILVHMILASHPEKTWSEIQPQLKQLNLSPSSLEAISRNIQSPQPLEVLLNQLNRDFAIPLLAQCCRIARLDGHKTSEEDRIIQAIATKFNLNLEQIESKLETP
ncbi:hypothetical protein H6G17_05735 [Chroococcidiopsis sp. FACHB-1243]|uniref:hypothetical protein n=1 Tax=Chroococcidiopsis sp. [FACHB-1243] TaxID=2692781 RepID=UPI001782DDA4|nr:hypothetical protein [Chroococcidiopsis sp. [FACHB-1243]]MBD2305015.1 hypothetical protein [Chroococcidiopsis sp. [FACHB-1243]]